MILSIIGFLLSVLEILIFIRVVLSFVVPDYRRNEFARLVHSITEPMLAPFRTIIPLGMGGIDLSPIIVLLIIQLLRGFLFRF